MIDLLFDLWEEKKEEMREVRYKGERHACSSEAGKIPANRANRANKAPAFALSQPNNKSSVLCRHPGTILAHRLGPGAINQPRNEATQAPHGMFISF